MKRLALLIIPAIFLFNTCALEIANVIGPGGGYVFYDKGNYNDGWRYIECSPFDMAEIKGTDLLESTDKRDEEIIKAIRICDSNSGGWYNFDWELPTEAQMKKMLECFSYGLTKFSPDSHYLTLNVPESFDYGNESTWKNNGGEYLWKVVILHKNFDEKFNGEPEIVEDYKGIIKVRPIRKF